MLLQIKNSSDLLVAFSSKTGRTAHVSIITITITTITITIITATIIIKDAE